MPPLPIVVTSIQTDLAWVFIRTSDLILEYLKKAYVLQKMKGIIC